MSSRRATSASLRQNTLFDGRPSRAFAAIVRPNCATIGAPGSGDFPGTVGSGAMIRSMRRTSSVVSSGAPRVRAPGCARALGDELVLEMWRHGARRLRRCDDGDDLELDDVAPLVHPLLEQAYVVALHHLIAMAEVGRDPTRDVA